MSWGITVTDSELHALYTDWSAWVRSKRYYSPSPNPQSVIGSLVTPKSPPDGDAPLDQRLAALHMVILGATDEEHAIIYGYYMNTRQTARYRRGTVPVKKMAAMMGVSRKTFYERLRKIRRDLYQRIGINGVA